jgi:ATP phosphoribosyltransferase regulatory subunit
MAGSPFQPSDGGRLRALFEAAGAHWLEIPVLHPADPFLETAGEDIRRKMFVTEGPTGERLALRPDFTIPVCLHHLASGVGPLRYGYEGIVFRRHDAGSPERLETGFEDIGRPARAEADAEALALAMAGVAGVAGGGLTARLGDIGLFVALLKALDLPEAWRRRLRRSFGAPQLMRANLDRLSAPRGQDFRLDAEVRMAAERRDRQRLEQVLSDRLSKHGHSEGQSRTPAEIAARFLDQRALAETQIEPDKLAALREFLALKASLQEAMDLLRTFAAERDVEIAEALSLFAERAAHIVRLAPGAEVLFEAGFGRPLDYYTGVVFEVRGQDFPYPIAGGGRYDNLMDMLGAGRPVPAVGFTIRLDLVTEVAAAGHSR